MGRSLYLALLALTFALVKAQIDDPAEEVKIYSTLRKKN
jgi:hypothetical protein